MHSGLKFKISRELCFLNHVLCNICFFQRCTPYTYTNYIMFCVVYTCVKSASQSVILVNFKSQRATRMPTFSSGCRLCVNNQTIFDQRIASINRNFERSPNIRHWFHWQQKVRSSNSLAQRQHSIAINCYNTL